MKLLRRDGPLAAAIGTALRTRPATCAAVASLSIADAMLLLIVPLLIERAFWKDGVPELRASDALLIIAFALVAAGLKFLRGVSSNRLSASLSTSLRLEIAERLLSLRPSYFHRFPPAEAAVRLHADVARMTGAVTAVVTDGPRHGLIVAGSICALVITAPWPLSGMAIALPSLALPGMLANGRLRLLAREWQQASAESSARISETLRAIAEAQSLGAERALLTRYHDAVRCAASTSHRHAMMRSKASAGYVLVATLVAAGAVLTAISMPGTAAARIALAGSTLFYGTLAVNGFLGVSELNLEAASATGAASRLHEIRSGETIGVEVTTPALPACDDAIIRFEGVSFTYADRPERKVLHDASLSLRPGECLGLAGPSGIGKSTMLSLMQRFETPNSGRILLEGRRIEEWPLTELRRMMAYVPQDPTIFSTSVRNNLLLARADADEEDLYECLRAANASSIVERLPKGLDALLLNGGAQLSLGEKKRLAIARALLKRAPIVLLDEPTASLDGIAEHSVLQAIRALTTRSSAIVVSHKETTLGMMDRVVTLDDGRLFERNEDHLRFEIEPEKVSNRRTAAFGLRGDVR